MVVTAGPAGADPTSPPAGRGFAEVLGGTTTLGLSIPGETVSGGAATIGVIAGLDLIKNGITGLEKCSE
jgi:hypothetical protein